MAATSANDESLIAFIDELNAKSLQSELTASEKSSADDTVEQLVQKLQRRSSSATPQLQFFNDELATRLLVERAHFLHYYRYERQMRAAVLVAARAARLRIALTGQIGRRTKFQTFDIAQLVLSVERESGDAAPHAAEPTATTPAAKPKTIILDDDTRLDQIEYVQSSTSASTSASSAASSATTATSSPATTTTTSSSNIQLRPVERALVLAMSASHAMRGARHTGGIGTDELRAYIDRALDVGSPPDWTVHTWFVLSWLVYRSRLLSNVRVAMFDR